LFYEYTLLIPAGTEENNPAEVDALVEPGVLTYAEVGFPNGCHQLVHVVIVEGKFQIAPRNPEGTMAADGYVIPIHPNYPLKRGHNMLKLKGWSPNTAYEHEIKVRLTVLPPEEADPWQALRDFISIVKKLIGLD